MRNVKIFVEGYHDRAFLSGWLKNRGFVDPGLRQTGARTRVINPIHKGKGGRRYLRVAVAKERLFCGDCAGGRDAVAFETSGVDTPCSIA